MLIVPRLRLLVPVASATLLGCIPLPAGADAPPAGAWPGAALEAPADARPGLASDLAPLSAPVTVPVAGSDRRYPHVWVSPGIYSLHFDSSKGLRNDNVGASVQLDLAPEHGFLAGTYINSNRARTHYGAYAWRPLQWRFDRVDVGLGAAIGAFDGYPNYRNGGWFMAPLPVASIEGRYLGANLIFIPTIANRLDGALGIQVRLRVW